jgi:hypothetical protein
VRRWCCNGGAQAAWGSGAEGLLRELRQCRETFTRLLHQQRTAHNLHPQERSMVAWRGLHACGGRPCCNIHTMAQEQEFVLRGCRSSAHWSASFMCAETIAACTVKGACRDAVVCLVRLPCPSPTHPPIHPSTNSPTHLHTQG